MYSYCLLFLLTCGVAIEAWTEFQTKHFRVGIEYDHSLPMMGGADRYRHRNNYDPFVVTVTATAKPNFVLSYLEVTITVDATGEVDFYVVRGQTGARTLVFQIVTNHTDFLSYNYLAYGIREDDYQKINNVITIPISGSKKLEWSLPTILTIIFSSVFALVL